MENTHISGGPALKCSRGLPWWFQHGLSDIHPHCWAHGHQGQCTSGNKTEAKAQNSEDNCQSWGSRTVYQPGTPRQKIPPTHHKRTKCVIKVASFSDLPTIQVWDQGNNLGCRRVTYSLSPRPSRYIQPHSQTNNKPFVAWFVLGMRLRVWEWSWNTDTKQISDHVTAPLFQHNCNEVSVMRCSHKFFICQQKNKPTPLHSKTPHAIMNNKQ